MFDWPVGDSNIVVPGMEMQSHCTGISQAEATTLAKGHQAVSIQFEI